MEFPEKTIINQKIPKKRFYDNIKLKTKIKNRFKEEIDSIIFRNKFSKKTIGIEKTKEVEEIFIFEIKLKENKYLEQIESLLKIIDKAIPYPILFKFNIHNNIIYKIAIKRRNEININYSIIDFYETKIINKKEENKFKEDLLKEFNSINLINLYRNIVKLLISKKYNQNQDFQKIIIKEKKQKEIKEKLKILENKLVKEKQTDKQFELYKQIKKLKEELKE